MEDVSSQIETDIDYALPEQAKDRFIITVEEMEEELYTQDWEKAYVELLSHIDENLYDPYGARAEAGDDPINTVTLFLYDFDADEIPELVVGDGI
jgi:hypothetical protein